MTGLASERITRARQTTREGAHPRRSNARADSGAGLRHRASSRPLSHPQAPGGVETRQDPRAAGSGVAPCPTSASRPLRIRVLAPAAGLASHEHAESGPMTTALRMGGAALALLASSCLVPSHATPGWRLVHPLTAPIHMIVWFAKTDDARGCSPACAHGSERCMADEGGGCSCFERCDDELCQRGRCMVRPIEGKVCVDLARAECR